MNKIMFMFFVTTLLLTGCSLQPPKASLENFQQKSISKISVNKAVTLNLDSVWPINGKGTYLQNITVKTQGAQKTLSLHLTLEPERIEGIAFNEIIGRLYHFILTPSQVLWKAAPEFEKILKPENIMADFLLIHLPLVALKRSLEHAIVDETSNASETTRLIQDAQGVIRKIVLSYSLGYLWKNVVIQNPEIGYELHIETVDLS